MKARAPIVLLICLIPWPGMGQAWQWSKHIGGPGADYVHLGCEDSEGNVYIHGIYAVPTPLGDNDNLYIDGQTLVGRQDGFLAKYAPDGDLLWVRNCTSPLGFFAISDLIYDSASNTLLAAGGYVASGAIDTCQLSTPWYAGFLARLNTEGHCLWARNITQSQFGGSGGQCLALDELGDIYVGGETASLGTTTIGVSTLQPGSFLAKYDPDGEQIWAKQVETFGDFDAPLSILAVRHYNGNLIAWGQAGAFTSADTLQVDTVVLTGFQGSASALMCFAAANGVAKWLRAAAYPDCYPSSLQPQGMDIDSLGNAYISNYFQGSGIFESDTISASGQGCGFVAKYDLDGHRQELWTYCGSLPAHNAGCSAIDVAPNGSFTIAGGFMGEVSLNGYPVVADSIAEMLIARFDSLGNCLGAAHAGVGGSLSVLDGSTGVYVTVVFPASNQPTGHFGIGGDAYTSYGWQDAVFAKHDLITGIGSFRQAENDQLIIYANPNNGSFHIKVPDPLLHEQGLLLTVYDNTGRFVRTQTFNMQGENPRMDSFDLAKGLYMVTLSKDGRSYHASMIVE